MNIQKKIKHDYNLLEVQKKINKYKLISNNNNKKNCGASTFKADLHKKLWRKKNEQIATQNKFDLLNGNYLRISSLFCNKYRLLFSIQFQYLNRNGKMILFCISFTG